MVSRCRVVSSCRVVSRCRVVSSAGREAAKVFCMTWGNFEGALLQFFACFFMDLLALLGRPACTCLLLAIPHFLTLIVLLWSFRRANWG